MIPLYLLPRFRNFELLTRLYREDHSRFSIFRSKSLMIWTRSRLQNFDQPHQTHAFSFIVQYKPVGQTSLQLICWIHITIINGSNYLSYYILKMLSRYHCLTMQLHCILFNYVNFINQNNNFTTLFHVKPSKLLISLFII